MTKGDNPNFAKFIFVLAYLILLFLIIVWLLHFSLKKQNSKIQILFFFFTAYKQVLLSLSLSLVIWMSFSDSPNSQHNQFIVETTDKNVCCNFIYLCSIKLHNNDE